MRQGRRLRRVGGNHKTKERVESSGWRITMEIIVLQLLLDMGRVPVLVFCPLGWVTRGLHSIFKRRYRLDRVFEFFNGGKCQGLFLPLVFPRQRTAWHTLRGPTLLTHLWSSRSSDTCPQEICSYQQWSKHYLPPKVELIILYKVWTFQLKIRQERVSFQFFSWF